LKMPEIRDNMRDATWEKTLAEIADVTAKNETKIVEWEAERIKLLSVDPRWSKPVVVCLKLPSKTFTFSGDEITDNLQDIAVLMNKSLPLVTHNGKSFDVPVLRATAVKLGLPNLAKQFDLFLTSPFYHDVHLDFMLWWEQRYGQHKAGLDCVAHQLGIKIGKYGSGADVYGWYQAGEMDKIIKHCQHDVQMLAECCIAEGAV